MHVLFGMWLGSVLTGSRGGLIPSGSIVDINSSAILDINGSYIIISV